MSVAAAEGEEEDKPEKHILVIGAGIIGLQCALTLLTEGNAQGKYKFKVSIVAEYMPGDEAGIYASAWAGGQWRSHESEFNRAAEWDVQTYRYWRDMIERGETDCGIAAVKGLNYWTSSEKSKGQTLDAEQKADVLEPWWSEYVDSYRRLEPAELQPGIALGVAFDTFTIDVQRYMMYIQQQIKDLGGQFVRHRLPSDQGLETAISVAGSLLDMPERTTFDAVINACGIQARELVGDENLYPIRGQVIRVRGIAKYCFTKLGPGKDDRTTVMPRPGAGITTIGVTVEPGVGSTEVDKDKIPDLLDAAKPYCPELLDSSGQFDVISAGVGIRPGRTGGARIEIERFNQFFVVHAYGVAGTGYQTSIGLARFVLNTLQIGLE